MSESKTSRFRFGRKATIGVLGGVVGAMLLYLTLFMFWLAITMMTPGAIGETPAIVIPHFEWVGLPLGFGGGALIALEEFGE